MGKGSNRKSKLNVQPFKYVYIHGWEWSLCVGLFHSTFNRLVFKYHLGNFQKKKTH